MKRCSKLGENNRQVTNESGLIDGHTRTKTTWFDTKYYTLDYDPFLSQQNTRKHEAAKRIYLYKAFCSHSNSQLTFL